MKRFTQFRLRTLFAITIVVGVAAWWYSQREPHADIVNTLRENAARLGPTTKDIPTTLGLHKFEVKVKSKALWIDEYSFPSRDCRLVVLSQAREIYAVELRFEHKERSITYTLQPGDNELTRTEVAITDPGVEQIEYHPFVLGETGDGPYWEFDPTSVKPQDFIFYDHEFMEQSAELPQKSRRHLEDVAIKFDRTDLPIVVEDTGNSDLDSRRRTMLMEQLARMGILETAERVLIQPVALSLE
jgi:hypothetical protein